MKSLPLPIRVAAGLAVTAVEQARTLPAKIAGLPVTVASQALQVSMRVQQQVTELAIRGDEVLSGLRPVEETPEWATFDEDVEDDAFDLSKPAPFESAFDRADGESEEDRRNGHHTASAETFATPDPWTQEERAIAEESEAHDSGGRPLPDAAGYDGLSLPQLRARLRRFTAEELAELLEYERAHGNRPSFVGMLTRRIATVRDQT
ncbi:MAG: lipid droplet-associated protein [Actinophytocola sp.]|uniref:lipid droplet-associated protein n=1 Tax=Actinophytocola sp. TaxID=1872138 RepID=UPI003C73E2FB